MVKRLALTLLLLLCFAASALADPVVPPLTGRVVDLAHVLDTRTVDALTRQLADHEASTTNQVVVVTLPDLQNISIEKWGFALLNRWGIGQRDKNNGVVLVVAPNDRRLRIEVGYGLDAVLTQAAAAKIIETEIVPRFKRGDLQGGVTAGVNAILATIDGTYRPLIEAPSISNVRADRSIWRFTPFVVFPLLFIAIVVTNISRRGAANRRGYYDGPGYGNRYRRDHDSGWSSRTGGFSSGRSSGGGFSGGGGRGGGGGASGRW